MIYPTRRTDPDRRGGRAGRAADRRSLAPAYWTGGLGLLALLLALCAGRRARRRRADATPTVDCEGPRAVGVGETFAVDRPRALRRAGAPRRIEFALGVDRPGRGAVRPARRGAGEDGGAAAIALQRRAARHGAARQRLAALDRAARPGLEAAPARRSTSDVLITPDIRAVRDKSVQMLNRDAMFGIKAQLQVGEGAEFEALADYRQGMDRRAIDWKHLGPPHHADRQGISHRAQQQYRHGARCRPGDVRAARRRAADRPRGLGRLAHRLVALKDGDRVGLFAFDSQPRAASQPIGGPRAFSMLQRVAAGIDYSASETNYTLGSRPWRADLNRRSLIIVFTEFADTISAELMLGAVGTLAEAPPRPVRRAADEELEALAAAEPAEPDDVSRAVTAAALLRERRLVITRLRHLGVHVVEAAAAEAGPALVNAYLDFKRRSLLVTAARQSPPLPRRARGRMAAARGHRHPRREPDRCARSPTRICWRCRSSIAARSPRSSVARETSLDLELITYLEGLCARAYFFVYGVRTSAWSRLGAFFARDWPPAVAEPVARDPGRRWCSTVIGVARRLSARRQRPGLVRRLVPPSWPAAAISAPRPSSCATRSTTPEGGGLSIFATFLFTHNSQVAILCFALGFAFGVPTAMLLIYNGAMLGAILALFASHGLGAELGGWLIIHGSTEILRDRPRRRGGLPDRLERGLPGRGDAARRRRRRRADRRDRRWPAWS